MIFSGKFKKISRSWKWALIFAAVILAFRILFFQAYKVPDFRMASTLLPGDRVLVNKFVAGLRIKSSALGISYFRLPALKKFDRQDVVVFNQPSGADEPIERKKRKVGRIVGLPGDTVLIWDKQLYINRGKVDPPAKGRQEFRVVAKGQNYQEEFLRKYNIEKPRMVADIGIYDYDLSPEAKEYLEKQPEVSNVRSTKQYVGDSKQDYYPPSSFYLWNRDQYGPLIVPSKGSTVKVEIKNIDLYRDIIETHEGHDISVDFYGVKIDGNLVNEYTFEKDYFFVLDDNRDNPSDSRKVGFIPLDHLIGKTKWVVWSGQGKYDYIKRFHLNRTFKRIR
jgi:signal peptidase I